MVGSSTGRGPISISERYQAKTEILNKYGDTIVNTNIDTIVDVIGAIGALGCIRDRSISDRSIEGDRSIGTRVL